jgi:ATPase family associated with various cellular activities (AAA)
MVLQQVTAEVELYIRSGYPCLALLSSEEVRCEEIVATVAKRLNRRVYTWSMTNGWTLDGKRSELKSEGYALRDEVGANTSSQETQRNTYPVTALEEVIQDCRGREVLLHLKDLHTFFEEPKLVRKLLDLITAGETWTVLFSCPAVNLPSLMEKEVTLVEVPLPDEEELREVLVSNLRRLAQASGQAVSVPQRLVERVLKAALGLTRRQADCVFRLAVANDNEFTEEDLDLIAQQKRQIIAKSGILEYYERSEQLDEVGGLDGLKTWLMQRQDAFSDKARAYGLPQPKGVFLLGVQGCGKSMISKAIASQWHMPLLRLDVGALFSSYIGRSEENLRNALRVAESVAPAVLWIDEIEKGFSGVQSSGNTDAGTTARVFGTFITWMQEKKNPVFVVATANSIDDLPPELLRKGRFDEIFFVDLPTLRERRDIVRIHIQRKGRDPNRFDIEQIARAADGFSGAEIEQALIAAMYHGFAQRREFETGDLVGALQETLPLSQTLASKIQALREWAGRRARRATTPDDQLPPEPSPTGRLRLIDPNAG